MQAITHKLQVGDILIQKRGEPWTFLARLFCGQPYPHARVVSRIVMYPPCPAVPQDKNPTYRIYTLENNWWIRETELFNLDDYEVWRPRCSDDIKRRALAWIEDHRGESYGFMRLIEIAFGYRWGLRKRPGMDDDLSKDNRLKVCSETIAMGYYRNGYDVAPHVQDIDTMPWDLRNDASEHVFG